MIEETEFCEFVDCKERVVTIVGPEGKHVCATHAIRYQRDVADRMNRDGDVLH